MSGEGPGPAAPPAVRAGPRSALVWMLRELALVVPLIVITLLVTLRAQSTWPTGPPWSLIGVHAAVLAYVAAAERGKLKSWASVAGRDLVWGALAGVFLLLIGGAYTKLLEAFGSPPPDVAGRIREMIPSGWLRLAWGAVLVPVAEELYFRGRLVDGLAVRLGRGAAAVVTSILFALAHGTPSLLPAHVVFGLILYALRDRTGRLVAPTLAHAINNAVGLIEG